jgi:NADPH-dependent 7-cyano-7-deazaguanine reductase QueF
MATAVSPQVGDKTLFRAIDWKGSREDSLMICQSVDWFTTRCPIDKQTDLARLEISYIPSGKLIDVLCLDSWTQSMKDLEIFAEALVQGLHQFLWEQLSPKFLEIAAHFNSKQPASVYLFKGVGPMMEELGRERRKHWQQKTWIRS